MKKYIKLPIYRNCDKTAAILDTCHSYEIKKTFPIILFSRLIPYMDD
jgi:hypothetical protein